VAAGVFASSLQPATNTAADTNVAAMAVVLNFICLVPSCGLGQIFGQRSLDFTQGGDRTTMQPSGTWIAAPEALMNAAIIVHSDFGQRA
jgi:hypothetical protein